MWVSLLTLCVVALPPIGRSGLLSQASGRLVTLGSLADACGARTAEGRFLPPPGYAAAKRKEKNKDIASTNTGSEESPLLKALRASITPVCRAEHRLRQSHLRALSARHSSGGGDGSGGGGGGNAWRSHALATSSEALRPGLLAVFCGHELCPTEGAAGGASEGAGAGENGAGTRSSGARCNDTRSSVVPGDFGCRQTARCLCYLRHTRHLPANRGLDLSSGEVAGDGSLDGKEKGADVRGERRQRRSVDSDSWSGSGHNSVTVPGGAITTVPRIEVVAGGGCRRRGATDTGVDLVHAFWAGSVASAVAGRLAASFVRTQVQKKKCFEG